MTIIRRLHAMLEPTKQAVMEMRERFGNASIGYQDAEETEGLLEEILVKWSRRNGRHPRGR